MVYYVYAIRSQSLEKIYIGHTGSLRKRLKGHNRILPIESSSYTAKNKGPWESIYQERRETRKEAVKREKQLKSAKGREFIKNKIRAASSMAEQLPLKQ